MSYFRDLVRLSSPFTFSVAFRILGDEDEAKDIVQETMVTIWQKMGKINSSDNYRMWLYRIAVNKCYDQLRRNKRTKEYNYDDSGWELISNHISDESPSELENKETKEILRLLTGNLSPKQKTVFVLCDLEEMTLEEASGITGMNKENIKANLHFARKKIKELLRKVYMK